MDGIGFRPPVILRISPKRILIDSLFHQKQENCSEENSHFGQWGGRMQLHVSHQKQAELVVVEIAAELFLV